MAGRLLQEHYVQVNSNWTRDVWAGAAETEEWKQWPAVKARFPVEAAKIPWEHYRHYASLVRNISCSHDGSTAHLRKLQKHCTGSRHPPRNISQCMTKAMSNVCLLVLL